MDVRKLERGGTAEWCNKCKMNVLPVGRSSKGHTEQTWRVLRWCCPTCSTETVPHA